MRTLCHRSRTPSRTFALAAGALVAGIASCPIASHRARAAENTTSESLRRDILAMDARLSDAYADCRTRQLRNLFERNAELIFAERGRLRGIAAHVDDLRRGGCAMRREAVASAQRIEALPGHGGAIDGAIQIGDQTFCAKQVQPCRGVATRFVAIWRRTDEGWKIARLIRYGYTAMP